MFKKIAIIGCGSFCVALSGNLSQKNHHVSVWSRSAHVVNSINERHRHPSRLTECFLSPLIKASLDIEKTLTGKDLIISALPIKALVPVWSKYASLVPRESLFLSLTKGIDSKSLKLPHEIFLKFMPDMGNKTASLSGPSFASEVSMGMPVKVVLASKNKNTAEKIRDMIETKNFNIVIDADVLGVEIGGAVKNVIAIAVGIADGLGLGAGAQASLITNGFSEIKRLAVSMGAYERTLLGLSGIGDLVLTCASNLSRNRQLGFKIAKGKNLNIASIELNQVTEGANSVKAVCLLGKKYSAHMPISNFVHDALFKKTNLHTILNVL